MAVIRSSHSDHPIDPEWLVNQIAHALRNPIFAAMVQAEALKLKAAGNSELLRSADMVHGQLKRLEGNIDEMLLLGRPARLNLREVELAPVVTGLAEAFRKGRHGEPVEVVARAVGPQHPISTDPEAVIIILERLIRNASQHSEPPFTVEVVLEAPDDDQQIVAVQDRGSGIADELSAKVFMPFFPQHAGRPGLGLAVAAKFAHALGGAIEIDTRPGEGTEVRVFLPVSGPAGS